MKAGKAVSAVRDSFESVTETFQNQVFNPILGEAGNELLGLFDKDALYKRTGTLAQEDLKRAREQKKIEEQDAQDHQHSQKIIEALKFQYKTNEQTQNKESQALHQEIQELQVEVVELAKSAGVESKIHLQNNSKKEKVSIQTLKLLRSVIKTLTLKAKEAKSASELVVQRSNAKTSGMLAWVSGKQMKIHEQGTLQLQG